MRPSACATMQLSRPVGQRYFNSVRSRIAVSCVRQRRSRRHAGVAGYAGSWSSSAQPSGLRHSRPAGGDVVCDGFCRKALKLLHGGRLTSRERCRLRQARHARWSLTGGCAQHGGPKGPGVRFDCGGLSGWRAPWGSNLRLHPGEGIDECRDVSGLAVLPQGPTDFPRVGTRHRGEVLEAVYSTECRSARVRGCCGHATCGGVYGDVNITLRRSIWSILKRTRVPQYGQSTDGSPVTAIPRSERLSPR